MSFYLNNLWPFGLTLTFSQWAFPGFSQLFSWPISNWLTQNPNSLQESNLQIDPTFHSPLIAWFSFFHCWQLPITPMIIHFFSEITSFFTTINRGQHQKGRDDLKIILLVSLLTLHYISLPKFQQYQPRHLLAFSL